MKKIKTLFALAGVLILLLSLLTPLRAEVKSSAAVSDPANPSAPSLSDYTPGFTLAQGTRSNDTLTVSVYLQNCLGIDAGSMIVKYDPAVLKVISVSNGKDADQVNNTYSNSYTGDYNATVSGTLEYSFYFKAALWDHDAFAADAIEDEPVNINSRNFEAARIRFRVIKASAADTALSLTVTRAVHEDKKLPGGYYHYNAVGSSIRICANHTWDAGVVLKPATASEDGEKKYTCRVCGATKTETVPYVPEQPYTPDDPDIPDGAPRFKLVQGDRKNGYIYVYVYLQNCVGMDAGAFIIQYDSSVIEFASVASGKDALQVAETESNSYTANANAGEPGKIEYSFYFKEALWDAETFAADAPDGGEIDINSDNFEAVRFRFKIKNEGASRTPVSLTVTRAVHEDKSLSGGYFHYNAKGDSILLFNNADPDVPVNDGSPRFKLERKDIKNGYVYVSVYLQNCLGLDAGAFLLQYDSSVLEFASAASGKDAQQVNNTFSNSYTASTNANEPDKIDYSFYFKEALWDAKNFAADAPDDAEIDIDSENFEAVRFRFRIKDTGADETPVALTVTRAVREDKSVSGGYYHYNAKGDYLQLKLKELPPIDTGTVKENDGVIIVLAGEKSQDLLSLAGSGAYLVEEDGVSPFTAATLCSGITLIKSDGSRRTVIVKGDNDGDGRVTAADARFALRIAVQLESPENWQIVASLVSGGTTVTAADARIILRVSVLLETITLN